jgi:hypothetical protein
MKRSKKKRVWTLQYRGKLNYPCSLQLDEEAIAMVFSKLEVSILR